MLKTQQSLRTRQSQKRIMRVCGFGRSGNWRPFSISWTWVVVFSLYIFIYVICDLSGFENAGRGDDYGGGFQRVKRKTEIWRGFRSERRWVCFHNHGERSSDASVCVWQRSWSINDLTSFFFSLMITWHFFRFLRQSSAAIQKCRLRRLRRALSSQIVLLLGFTLTSWRCLILIFLCPSHYISKDFQKNWETQVTQ